jgi:hypothetical protein
MTGRKNNHSACSILAVETAPTKTAKPTFVGWLPQFEGWKSTQVDFAIW